MTETSAVDLYYDPFDVEIDSNPYPVWKRMREEAPLYYNEKHNPNAERAHTASVRGWVRLPVVTA
jgi:hypothetical protein